MSEEQKPRDVRMIPDPNRHHGVRILTEGHVIRDLEVAEAEKWSDDDMLIRRTDHDVRGSTSEVMRLTDQQAQELFGKLATYLLGKGLLGVQKAAEEPECGDYPAPCNHDPAHEDQGPAQPDITELPDEDLPGMWEKADFMGGDPDSRSYAQRQRDEDEDVQAFDSLRDHLKDWHKGSPFTIANTFFRAGLQRGRGL